MSMKKINEIRQRHLATKQRLVTERAAAAKTHDAAVNALYEKILQHLDSEAAYDDEGFYVNVYTDSDRRYKNTAWAKVSCGTDELNCVIEGTTHIELPKNTYAEYLDYNWGEETFMRILRDVLKKFEQLEGFEVIDYRVIMLLEE